MGGGNMPKPSDCETQVLTCIMRSIYLENGEAIPAFNRLSLRDLRKEFLCWRSPASAGLYGVKMVVKVSVSARVVRNFGENQRTLPHPSPSRRRVAEY
jgi:hypothetical protein